MIYCRKDVSKLVSSKSTQNCKLVGDEARLRGVFDIGTVPSAAISSLEDESTSLRLQWGLQVYAQIPSYLDTFLQCMDYEMDVPVSQPKRKWPQVGLVRWRTFPLIVLN